MKHLNQGFIPTWVLAMVVFLVLGGVAIAIGNKLTAGSYPVASTGAASLLNVFSTTATSTGTSTP